MPRVFDYTQADMDIPMRYDNVGTTTKPIINGTWVDYGVATSGEVKYPFCDIEVTNGQLLTSDSRSLNNIACEPHSYNVGNYYNFPAASANTPEPAVSSICSRGWMLPQDNGKTSYSDFLIAYGVDYNASVKSNYDSALLNLPLSFLRSGGYNYVGNKDGGGKTGFYSMARRRLYFGTTILDPYNTNNGGYTVFGHSLRCGGVYNNIYEKVGDK